VDAIKLLLRWVAAFRDFEADKEPDGPDTSVAIQHGLCRADDAVVKLASTRFGHRLAA